MQVSNDTGQSFGPTLKLALNGTIGWSSQGRQFYRILCLKSL
jgi:hypothetical protein